MSVYVSPGVYVREVDLSLYIPALSTTIVGMVGVTSKGPSQVRTYISNQQQFIDTFGAPDDTIGYESYAALQYLRQGRQLWFVRVVGDSAASAAGTFSFATAVASEAISTEPDGTLTAFADTDPDGDVFAELGDSGIVPGSVTITVVTKTSAESVEITDNSEGVLSGAAAVPAEFAATGTIDYATGEWTLTTTGTYEIATGSILAAYEYLSDAFVATALSEGEWGNNISLTIEDGTQADTVKIKVFYNGYQVEMFDSIDLDDTTGNAKFIETKINDVSDYISVDLDAALAGASTKLPEVVSTAQSLAGGDTDASSVTAISDGNPSGTGGIVGQAWNAGLAQATGMQLFASPDAVDINLLAAPGWSDAAAVVAMITLCESRKDCMAIIDPPNDLRPSEVVDWHNGEGSYAGVHAAFNSSYAALYYPWLKIYDTYNSQYLFTPPSGHILSVYAYTDQNTESWFAPAGMNRGRLFSAVDIAYGATPGERDLLYGDGNAINPIANMNNNGIVVWGQRTLQRAPTALDRVNVRRLMLYLRKAISTACNYLVFEPNDEKTWRQFGHLVVPYLNDVTQRRGLYDFRVQCDETTNTPEVIDRNQMNARIFLKPVKAAEFIQIDLVITRTGVDFDEIIY